MGYNKFNLTYILDILKHNNISNMLELGNQCINNREIEEIKEKWGKEYFTNIGITHTSIDWNGKNGSLKLDLTQPFDEEFINAFEIVTNCGTTEHVELQYEVFKNLHDCGKVGCFYMNSVPLDTVENKNKNGVPTNPHGIYEYNTLFFIKLCQLCNYEIVNINTDKSTWAPNNQGLCNAIYKKKTNESFISKETFQQLTQYLKYYSGRSRA